MSPLQPDDGADLHQPPAETTIRNRVARACARCRRQKLKCDAARPCTLCRHSGIRCEPREAGETACKRPTRKRQRRQSNPVYSNSQPRTQARSAPDPQSQSPGDPLCPPPAAARSPAERQRFGANSSAVAFAAHIFGHSAASHSSHISSIPGHDGRSTQSSAGASPRWSLLTMSRPPTLVMEALVDAFFDRMNWFTMIFHETSFRASAQRIFSNDSWERDELGPVLAVLMVSALGLQCVVHDPSWAGHKLLAEASLGSSVLLDALITEVRIHLLDLLDDCCIETVQVCSLLGTYYIFHASPTLAWSILGLSVRTAYALALHCDDDDQDVDPIVAQVRRRNWNHITVADTFAAMVYGRPASLDAAFSYLHPLQDLDDTRVSAALASHPLLAPSDHSRVPVTRATFHFLKARLYEIIRQALNRFRVLRLQNPISAEDLASLVQAVQYSRSRLEAWREDLPPIFDCDPDSGRESLDSFTGDESLSPEDQTVLRHLSLQSLTLQVTYDSAVIFVHRPLLEYRVAVESRPVVPSHLLEVVRESLDLSVNAALRISRVPVVRLETQFSISFVLMNFFTAGVILCIPPTIWPFSAVAHDAKAGTLRIIRASRSLRDVTQIAPHTEKLLTELLRLSLQQEVDLGLQHDRVDRQSEMNKQTLEQAQHASSRELAYREDDEEPQIHANLQHQNPILDSELLSAPGTSTAMRPGLALNQDTSVGDHMNIVPPSSDAGHHDDHMVPGFDIAWPPLGYDGQRNQVDSQLDEVFGTFGQILFNLVPNDPYSAWNWGSGSF